MTQKFTDHFAWQPGVARPFEPGLTAFDCMEAERNTDGIWVVTVIRPAAEIPRDHRRQPAPGWARYD